MSTIAIEPYLVDHPLFTWLDHRYIQFIAENAEQIKYNPNDYVFQQGEIANRFYIIIHGRVAVEAQRIRTRCEEDHNFGYEIMKRFASVILQRLHALTEQVISLNLTHKNNNVHTARSS